MKLKAARNPFDLLAFVRDPAVFTAGAGLTLGDFYHLRLPGYDVHVVTDPALLEAILVTHGDHFDKSRIYWRELRRLVGEAMGSLSGERWKYLRQVQQPFFTPRAVQRYLTEMEQITTAYFDALAARVHGGRDIQLSDVLAELNVRILLTALFGHDELCTPLEVARRIADGEATIAWRSKFPWRPITAWLTGANQRAARHKRFFANCADRLSQLNGQPDTERLLHALLRVHTTPEGPGFPRSLVRNEIIVNLGAGTETQSVAEAWALYLLWQHPDALRRVRDEVRAVASDAPAGVQHLGVLPYTVQVLRETLRLYPPSYALARDCVAPLELAGRRVHKGQVFFISVFALHRNPRLWQDPETFDPDRFASQRAEQIGKYEYLPFGAGKHVCIGQHFALPCMTLALAQFAQRFDWSFHQDTVRPVGLSTLKPAGPLPITLTPRA